MNEDAAAKEVERLLRDALNAKPESAQGRSPAVQLRTVPLAVQPVPLRRAEGARSAPPPNGPEGLADRLTPETVVAEPVDAPRRSRWSLVAVAAIGAIALAAAGGAIWRARGPVDTAQAHAAMTPPSRESAASSEGALGIALTARPTDVAAPTGAAPAATVTAEATATATATATTDAEAKEAKEATAAKASAAKEAPKARRAPLAARPQPRATKADVAEAPVEAPKAERPAPAKKEAPASKSVDALLQQQLSGAIP